MLSTKDEDRLLLIPGPTPVAREILDALSRPTISHTSTQLAEELLFILNGLKRLTDNEAGKVFVFSGSGTFAQEAAILNFVEPSDRLLVVSNGFFADRLADIAKAHELDVEHLKAPWGQCVPPDEVAKKIDERGITVVTFTHVETSTGVMAPLDEYVPAIREGGAISIVDGVAGLGGVPEEMARLSIDVLLSGSQKALGVPPGLAIVACGPIAWEKRIRRRSSVGTYFADLIRWAPVMEKPETYFSTHPVNLMYALSRSIQMIDDEGLEERYARHLALAQIFREGLLKLRFEPFTDPNYLSPTLSVFKTPVNVPATELRARLHEAGVVVAGGIGDAANRILRFGHMGNISRAEIAIALDAIESCLAEGGVPLTGC